MQQAMQLQAKDLLEEAEAPTSRCGAIGPSGQPDGRVRFLFSKGLLLAMA